MPRSLPEWIGDSADTKIPPRVRLRVWVKYQGRCAICDRIIGAGEVWDADHCKALIDGGENREGNIWAVCRNCHAAKTRFEVALKSKSYRIRAKHAGIKRKKSLLPGSKGSGVRKRMSGQVWRE